MGAAGGACGAPHSCGSAYGEATAPCTAEVTMANYLSMAHWRAVAPLPVGRLNLCVARDIFGYTITRGYIF